MLLSLSPWLTAAASPPQVDAHPALLMGSAAPMPVAQVEAGGAALMLVFAGTGTGGLGRASVGLHERVHVELLGVTRETISCCRPREPRVDGIARLGVALLARDDWRVTAWVGSGTQTQAGVATWWRSPDQRFEFDAAWGPTWETNALFGVGQPTWATVGEGPVFRYDAVLGMPEIGVTWSLDARGAHRIRFGQLGPLPLIGYRARVGPVAVEASVGALWVANVASISAGASF